MIVIRLDYVQRLKNFFVSLNMIFKLRLIDWYQIPQVVKHMLFTFYYHKPANLRRIFIAICIQFLFAFPMQ